MRIESPRYTERFGSVRINDVQQVLELDSGRAKELTLQENIAVQKIEEDVVKDFEEKMAIIIPTKDEKLKLFEGVVSGVPHECLIIVVSNSQRRRTNRTSSMPEYRHSDGGIQALMMYDLCACKGNAKIIGRKEANVQ